MLLLYLKLLPLVYLLKLLITHGVILHRQRILGLMLLLVLEMLCLLLELLRVILLLFFLRFFLFFLSLASLISVETVLHLASSIQLVLVERALL